jgi:hypothetical protein
MTLRIGADKVKRLKVGDRIKITGGYDMDPPWLKGGTGYIAIVIGFFDNHIEKRQGDSAVAVTIEFEEEIEHKGFKGKYGFLLGRYADQKWIAENHGIHVHISKTPIEKSSDISKGNSVWAESHASYQQVSA